MKYTENVVLNADVDHPYEAGPQSCTVWRDELCVGQPFSIWRHYKGGLYVLLGRTQKYESARLWTLVNDADLSIGMRQKFWKPGVVYASVRTGEVWVRNQAEWKQEVDVGGMKIQRFQQFSGPEK